MLGKDKGMKNIPHKVSNHTTLISCETEVVGSLRFSGSLEIEGRVRGNIVAVNGQPAVVRVLEQGSVEGNIAAPVVIINGVVKGDIHASQEVELAAKARVEGNVHYTLVEMHKGAQVNGNLVYAVAKPGLKVAAGSGPAPGNS